MLPTDPVLYLTPLALFTLILSLYEIRKTHRQLAKEKKEIQQRMYETLILREIGERIGYELNIERILETIVASLNKFIPFSVASYILVSPDPEKLNYKVHLDESVSQQFLDQIRDNLLRNISETTGRSYSKESLLEHSSGTLVDPINLNKIGSLWITPLKINDRGVGTLALASTKSGLYHGPEMEVLTKILAQANWAVNQLEEVIKTEQSKILSMISSMPDGVLMLDLDSNLIAINPACASLLGLEHLEKVTILDVAKILSDKVDLRTKIDEAANNGQTITFDNFLIKNKFVRLYISPATNKHKDLVGSVVIFHDITPQKELERVREDFTAMMVHELRAPLTVISGSTDMFLETPDLINQTQGKELMHSMKNSTTSMLDLVNDLLDAAKIEAGKFQIVKVKGDLKDVLAEKTTFFQQLASPKQITIENNTSMPLITQFDRERISQVLNNLFSNAIKFTPIEGKITVSAKIINSASDIPWHYPHPSSLPVITNVPAILMSISDTGVGISSDQIANLFSKFLQLGKSPSGQHGTGLGLVVTKGIVESHGGTIFAESEVNSGTTFHFTLPISS